MPRPGRRTSLTIAVAALALSAVPAAAQAASYTVQTGGDTCGAPGDLVCGSLSAAAAAVNAGSGGDTVSVTPGTYTESASFNQPNTTISGTASGVTVLGTITFGGGAGAASTLDKIVVIQTGAAPAVNATSPAGLAVSDAVLVSGTGHGLTATAGDLTVTRSHVFAGPNSNAIDVYVTTSPVDSTLDSSVLSGGGNGAGIRVRTANVIVPPSNPPDVTLTARHVTIAGATTAMILDASGALGSLGASFGDINATVTDSIVKGNVAQAPNPGVAPLIPPNLVTVSFTRTEQSAPDQALFVNPGAKNYHLRADAPVIDQGGLTPGESTTDIDGEPRAAGAASDLGADEFVNKPPSAKIRVVTKVPRDGQPVQFDGSGSTDQAGDKIVGYLWTFGDGSKQTTATPTVTHTYKGEGTVTATLVAVDIQGASSEPDSAQLKITDGVAPTVKINKPKNRQTINRFTTTSRTVTKNGVATKVKARTRGSIGFSGTAKDKSGVLAVYLTVEKIGSASKSTVAQGRQASTKKCTWLDPKKGLRKTPCSKPITIKVKLKSTGSWSYAVAKSIKLSAGGYRAIVYGLDKTGMFGNSAPKASRNIRFTLK